MEVWMKFQKKNLIIYIAVSFLCGLLIGACLTLLFFPQPECVCEEVGISLQNEEEQITDVKGEESRTVVESSTINTEVSLPVSQCSLVIDIAGAVEKPGVYCLGEGSHIMDAVLHAKGFIEGVAHKYVSMNMNLSSKLTDRQKIYIPFETDVYCELKTIQMIDTEDNASNTAQNDNMTNNTDPICININTASLADLTGLSGIGESTAQKIIDGRPYSETEDILNVSGIGESTYEKFKDDICVF